MSRTVGYGLAALAQLALLTLPTAVWGPDGRLHEPAVMILLAVLVASTLAEASVAEETRSKAAEHRSRALAQGTGVVLLMTHVLAVSGLGRWPGVEPGAIAVAVGAALVLAGAAIRRWSVRTLGRHFRSGWTVRPDQPLVTTGPFVWSRNPSEVGLLLGAVGVLLLSANAVAVGLVVLVLLPLTLWRIAAEEAALGAAFGAAHARYVGGTPRLVGWVRRPTIRTI